MWSLLQQTNSGCTKAQALVKFIIEYTFKTGDNHFSEYQVTKHTFLNSVKGL